MFRRRAPLRHGAAGHFLAAWGSATRSAGSGAGVPCFCGARIGCLPSAHSPSRPKGHRLAQSGPALPAPLAHPTPLVPFVPLARARDPNAPNHAAGLILVAPTAGALGRGGCHRSCRGRSCGASQGACARPCPGRGTGARGRGRLPHFYTVSIPDLPRAKARLRAVDILFQNAPQNLARGGFRDRVDKVIGDGMFVMGQAAFGMGIKGCGRNL